MERNHFERGAMRTGLGFLGVALIFAFMVLLAFPVVHRARRDNHARDCIRNLAELMAAKERYLVDLENKTGKPVPPDTVVKIEDLLRTKPPRLALPPVCPDGGTYSLGTVKELPSCSKASAGHVLPMVGQKRIAIPGVVSTDAVTTSTAGK